MAHGRRCLSETDHRRIEELYLEKIAYHEAGHAVCLLHCGIPVEGLYLHPTPMPAGAEGNLGLCRMIIYSNEVRERLFSCAGACYGETLAPGIGELRQIAAEHPSPTVRGDVKKILNVARREYNASLLEEARARAEYCRMSEQWVRTLLKDNWEPKYHEFCESKEFAGAVKVLAKCLLSKRIVTSQRILSGRFLKIPVLKHKRQ